MLAPSTQSERPIAVLGAGDLVSHLYRGPGEAGHARYRFNLYRLGADMQVTHELRPCDLRDLVKLCQVLAFAIVDDGWSADPANAALQELNEQLDSLTQCWSEGCCE